MKKSATGQKILCYKIFVRIPPGVGLKTNVREMLKQGIRPFVVGLVGEGVIAALTLGLLVITNIMIGL